MAALFDEVSCHRETHHAETEKSDFRHSFYLGILGQRPWKWAGRFLEGGPHHNPCAGEGNGFVWLKRRVMCYDRQSKIGFTKTGVFRMGVSVGTLDHFNIRTRNFSDTVRFYEDVLGL